jgi:DNA replication protein DnaC
MYAGCTLDNFTWERLANETAHAPRHRGKPPEIIRDLARAYARDTETLLRGYQDALLENLRMGRGLYLFGHYGAGKSHLLCAMITKACSLGVPSERVNEGEYLQKLKDSYDEDGKEGESSGALFRHYAALPLLGLEEFCGNRHRDGKDGWAADEIAALLEARYRARHTTLFTANYKPAELDAEFRPGILSRIRGTCFVLEVIATDYRADVQAQNLRTAARQLAGLSPS